jgi:methyl-accepting chemotaxis protein
LLGTAIIVLVSFLISRRFANQVEHVKQVVETMGIGNFTKQVKVRTRDEIGKMGTSLNTAIAQIANIISEVKTTSEFVSKSTVSLAEGAAQLKQTSKEIAGSVEEVASGAEKQSNNVQELSSYMEELSASFEETSTNVTKVSQIAAQTQEASKTGKVHIDQSVQQMGIIDQSVQEIEQVMNRLDERTKEIHKFTAVITEIASQTNLLALNAAIEAARAGEQGRGFAVVAGEVKKLAEQSSRSADEIRNILTNILEESDRSQTTVKLGSNAVKKGISVIEQTGQSFDEIYASVAQVAVELDKISLSIDEVNKGAQDVTKSVVELGTFNEEASTHTQNVAASVEEQTVMTNEIYVAVQAMAEKVQQLNELGKKFTI